MLKLKVVAWLFIVLWGLAGCGGGSGGADGSVSLNSPQDTAVIYASAVYVSGTAEGIGEDGLLVRLTGEDGAVLAESMLMKPDAEWQAEIIHGYSGEPQLVTVDVLPVSAGLGAAENTEADTQSEPYASVGVILAALAHRPEGTFADVIFPEDGAEVGGDQFQVRGRVSGVEDGSFDVMLVSSDGTTIDNQTVTLTSPYAVDDQPWTVDLSLNGYTGSAVINVTFTEDLSLSIPVVLRAAAG